MNDPPRDGAREGLGKKEAGWAAADERLRQAARRLLYIE
jgi:hypothetical protein